MATDTPQESTLRSVLWNTREFIQLINALASWKTHELWVGGGYLRNLYWDHFFKVKSEWPLNDVDIIYFDTEKGRHHEQDIHNYLFDLLPSVPWEVREQSAFAKARGRNIPESIEEVLAGWVETATAIAYSPLRDQIIAPYGLSDLLMGRCRATREDMVPVMSERIQKKGWKGRWPELELITI